jgi:small subunit ribosomal protein S35
MAAALHSFRLTARSCRCRSISHRYTTKSIGRRRAFSATPFRGRGREDDIEDEDGEVEELDSASALKRAKRQKEEYLYSLRLAGNTREDVAEEAAFIEAWGAPGEESGLGMPYAHEEMEDKGPKKRPSAKLRNTFMNMGEDELIEEEEDNSPGISTLGHGELEAHREKRHYARLAAWEMPLLSSKYSLH